MASAKSATGAVSAQRKGQRRGQVFLVVLGVVLLTAALSAQVPERARDGLELPSIEALLDRYRAGAFDSAVKPLSSADDPEAFRASFIKGADAWIARAPADSVNRRFVAAALAVEVAHARLAHDNLSTIRLLDWATRHWRRGPPTAPERVWTLAAVALVERGGRQRIGFPPPPESSWGLAFITDATKRFPDEPRFRLARTVWLPSRRIAPDLEKLTRDPIVGPDALVELAYLQFWDRDYQAALRFARRAADQGKEIGTQYMAHFLIGFCHEAQGSLQEAVREYATALKVVPHAQSASIALALLLMRDNQAEAALGLIDRSMTERSHGDDPWRLFAYGGYVRWPLVIADLRKAIQ
jgi:tetratricopeptide (TPR) repeat protein